MENVEAQKVRRRPWLAMVLSLLAPGFGQMYCCSPKRAAAYAGAFAAWAIVASILLPAVNDLRWDVGWTLGGAILCIVAAVDSWRLAKRTPHIVLKQYNRWYVYLVGIAAATGLSSLASANFDHRGESFYSASASMEPGMPRGERWIASKIELSKQLPERGSIIVFEHPTKPDVDYVKRLIALPGESVQMVDGYVMLDGVEAKRTVVEQMDDGSVRYREVLPNGYSYDILEMPGVQSTDNTDMMVVPDDSVFVLGDNRDRSQDSRFGAMGPVPIDNIKGVAEFVLWSSDVSRIGMRFQSLQE